MGQTRNGRDDASRISTVHRWQASGLSGREFARLEGISPVTLQRWSQLADKVERQRRRARSTPVAPSFVEVQIASESRRGAVPAEPQNGELWVATRAGHQVRMEGGLDRDSLAMVLEVLASC
jgi:hypothetical protein